MKAGLLAISRFVLVRWNMKRAKKGKKVEKLAIACSKMEMGVCKNEVERREIE